MKNILTMTQLTIQEAFAKKVFIAFFIISTIVLIAFLVTFMMTPIDSMLGGYKFAQQQGKIPINQDILIMLVNSLKNVIAMPLFVLGLFLSIFSVSSFIPTLLEKGYADVILSKPVSRTQVLLGKYFGGFIVVFLNVAFLIAGIFILIGFKFGIWDASFLYTILTITFTFAVLYALIVLMGVTTQNSIASMMVCYFIFIILSPLLANRQVFDFVNNDIFKKVLDVLYYIVPKTEELGKMTRFLVNGEVIETFQPVYTSAAFLILTFGLSIFIFNKKDY